MVERQPLQLRRVAKLRRDGAREQVVIDGDVAQAGASAERGRNHSREEVVGEQEGGDVAPVAQPWRNLPRQLVALH